MNLPYFELIRGAGAVAAGSLLWLQYWDLKDRRRPEPRLRLFAACALGGLASLYDAILYLGGSLFLIAGVVLVLWIGVSVAARHAAMDDGVAEPAMAPAGLMEMRPRGDPEVRP